MQQIHVAPTGTVDLVHPLAVGLADGRRVLFGPLDCKGLRTIVMQGETLRGFTRVDSIGSAVFAFDDTAGACVEIGAGEASELLHWPERLNVGQCLFVTRLDSSSLYCLGEISWVENSPLIIFDEVEMLSALMNGTLLIEDLRSPYTWFALEGGLGLFADQYLNVPPPRLVAAFGPDEACRLAEEIRQLMLLRSQEGRLVEQLRLGGLQAFDRWLMANKLFSLGEVGRFTSLEVERLLFERNPHVRVFIYADPFRMV